MKTRKFHNWLLAMFLAIILCLGTALPGPDDIETAQMTADAVTQLGGVK